MNCRNRINILGVFVDKVDKKKALERVNTFLKTDRLKTIFTPNTEMVMVGLKDKELLEILNNGDLVVSDGIGLVYASRKYGDPLPERVAGFDLMVEMLDLLAREKKGIFLLGGKPGIAGKAAEQISARFPGVEVKGYYHGYFKEDENSQIIEKINSTKPDVIFVALGSPKQEKWVYRYKDLLNAKIVMGVGGSFDVLSGNVKRAPEVFRKMGLEWFYRLITQPWRAKRMLVLPVFAIKVLLDKKGGK